MSQIVSFEDYTPPARFDSIPWSDVLVEEAVASTGPWVEIDTIALSPLDPDPAEPIGRSFTTNLASDDPDLWYRVTFTDGGGNTTLPSAPVQNLQTLVAPYATVDELFRVLKVRTPTVAQTEAAESDLTTATIEINAELGLGTDTDPLTAAQLDLVKTVCIDRAADLWRHTESVPGLVGIPDEAMPTTFGRYSWNRYAERLAPIKQEWGLA